MSVKEKIKQRAVDKQQAHPAKKQSQSGSVLRATATNTKTQAAAAPLRTTRRILRKQHPTTHRFQASFVQFKKKLFSVRESMPSSAQTRKRKQKFKPLTMTTAGIRQLLAAPRLMSFMVLMGCCIILYYAYTNPRFYLNNIHVDGIGYVSPNAIIQASGLEKMHIFGVEPKAVADSIREVPGVLSAEVEVKWPNNTHIIIQEDAPQLIWEENGESYWVDKKGNLIPIIDQSIDLPRISAEPRPITPFAILQPNRNSGLEKEETLVTTKKTSSAYFKKIPTYLLENIARLVAFRPTYKNLRYTETHGLVYNDPDGWEVYLGMGDNIEYKIAVYEGVRDNLLERGIAFSYINVAHSTVFYMPLSTPGSVEGIGQP